jgi:hypothetical protein
MNTKNISVHHVASTASNTGLDHEVTISDYIVAEEGYCVVVVAKEEKQIYNQLECSDGKFYTVREGDVIVGVLGERKALKGYSGGIPRDIKTGDILNILNMGGIVGKCTSDHPDLGRALRVEILGAAMVEKNGSLVHARIQDAALAPSDCLEHSAPIVMVSGTAMNTGKTWAACEIISGLTAHGLRVAGAKATGASLKRDATNMSDHGAIATATFTDAGIVSSTSKSMSHFAKGLIKHLNSFHPDVIVIELGDGLIGYYGVDELLLDKELQQFTVAHVVTASDLVGVWAADELFKKRYKAPITVVAGPVTDNAVGKQYIRQVMGIPALNARTDNQELADLVAGSVHDEVQYVRIPGRGFHVAV